MLPLDKVLCSQGLGSRKQVRALIAAGRVQINHTPQADYRHVVNTSAPTTISIDQTDYAYHPQLLLALHKPLHYECSHNPSHHNSVYNLLPAHYVSRGVQCVGRLDADTTGLLLLTDDGALLHRLSHPKKQVAKHYVVTLEQPLPDDALARLQQGISLKEFGPRLFVAHTLTQTDTLLSFSIYEGVHHQVKRMVASVGGKLTHLHRSQIGNLCLNALTPALAPGQYSVLTAEQGEAVAHYVNR
jgi:16S rRNA pseudouridine516 synthase